MPTAEIEEIVDPPSSSSSSSTLSLTAPLYVDADGGADTATLPEKMAFSPLSLAAHTVGGKEGIQKVDEISPASPLPAPRVESLPADASVIDTAGNSS